MGRGCVKTGLTQFFVERTTWRPSLAAQLDIFVKDAGYEERVVSYMGLNQKSLIGGSAF
jgi:hypothetical protein